MKDRLHHWLPLVPLLLLMAGTYWLSMQAESPGIGGRKNLRHDPDYIIDNFTATTLDEKGKIRFVMSAKKMWHYPDDDTTHLEHPRIESITAEYPPLLITALNGELSSKGDEIFLRNDVVIFRPAYAGKGEMTFKSNYLHVVPHKDIATTDQPVSMTDANTILNAVGMELDNKSHTIKFLSRVRTVYEPSEK